MEIGFSLQNHGKLKKIQLFQSFILLQKMKLSCLQLNAAHVKPIIRLILIVVTKSVVLNFVVSRCALFKLLTAKYHHSSFHLHLIVMKIEPTPESRSQTYGVPMSAIKCELDCWGSNNKNTASLKALKL